MGYSFKKGITITHAFQKNFTRVYSQIKQNMGRYQNYTHFLKAIFGMLV